jgi:hypothetical protein
MGNGEGSTKRIFIVCIIHLIQSGIKSRELKWKSHVARMEKVKSAFNILTGKPIGQIPLGRFWLRWEDNIRMNL